MYENPEPPVNTGMDLYGSVSRTHIGHWRIFMYINFSAIHYPNCHYVEGKMKDDKVSHAAALQYVDSQLPRLFQAFQKRGNTLVIALSDHGTCYGEDGYEYHCISHETVYTVPYKHFILTKK